MANVGVSRMEKPFKIIVDISTLKEEAAVRLVKELGQPRSSITHVVFYSASIRNTKADSRLTSLLDAGPCVQYLPYEKDRFDSKTASLCCKDLSHNNPGRPVLVVCSELTPTSSGGLSPEVEELQIHIRVITKEMEKLSSDNRLLKEKALEFQLRAEKAEARLRAEARLQRSSFP
ncbi:chalcone synthase 4-like [Raphanus sativus]|uniref:Chalcone synthase 4 n=1 Tax=Raphanus sativus TaxID=3726 RepID=A0A6J0MV16_RAPSA|nr:chalcone synthase 4 [Raphanus sativus]KAJ4907273.1 chalcone synthase 4-like [Raphanus sativus]